MRFELGGQDLIVNLMILVLGGSIETAMSLQPYRSPWYLHAACWFFILGGLLPTLFWLAIPRVVIDPAARIVRRGGHMRSFDDFTGVVRVIELRRGPKASTFREYAVFLVTKGEPPRFPVTVSKSDDNAHHAQCEVARLLEIPMLPDEGPPPDE